MDKKELILTVAKDLMAIYKPPFLTRSPDGETPKEVVIALGGVFSELVKQIEKTYDSIGTSG